MVNPPSLVYFVEEGAVEIDAEDPEVHQGYLEMSNANVVKEMVNMITISRTDFRTDRFVRTVCRSGPCLYRLI